jgi:hypothetical protein
VIDLWSPEINSIPVPIPSVQGCKPLPDPGAAKPTNAWTDSFQNIRCYDQYKVQAVLNWIDGKWHDGSATAPVPNIVRHELPGGQRGREAGGKIARPDGRLSGCAGNAERFAARRDPVRGHAIGQMVSELNKQGLLDSTLIIVSAKHGQSPIDPSRVLRIPADNAH